MSTKRPSHAEGFTEPLPAPPSPRVVPFPLALNLKIVSRLVDRFLSIPAGPDRAVIWRRRDLGNLERKRIAQGIAPEIVQEELLDVEDAVAVRLAAMFPDLADAS